jgi:hypothetical protein
MSERARTRARWRGFSVAGDQLWYRPPSGRSHRPGLRFEADGLVVVEPDGAERTLPWDDGEKPGQSLARPAWSLHALPRGRGNWVVFRLTIGPPAPRQVRLRSGSRPPSSELPALCRYLAGTPEARPGLDRPDRIQRLLGELASGDWRRPEPPQEPLAGERLDLHQAVEQALVELDWRLIDGRPVAGEPRPPVDGVTAAVWRTVPEELAGHVSDTRVGAEVERHLSVGGWPFNVLL